MERKKLKNIIRETVEWRILATLLDTLIIYCFTGHIWKATALGFTLMVVKSIAYYTWSRYWKNGYSR